MSEDKNKNNIDSRIIIDSIRRIAGTLGLKPTQVISGNVESVDEDDRTCDVTAILSKGEITLSDVNLSAEQNDGLVQIPAVDSTVIIAMMPDGENYCIAFSDIDAIICYIDGNNSFRFSSSGFILNGGLLGGLINIDAQTAKLNALVAELQAQLVLIAAGIATGGGSYSPGNLSQFNTTDYEDQSVKH